MDLKEYEIALDTLSVTIIPRYFNNRKYKYDEAKQMLLEIFNREPIHNDILSFHPFFYAYFKKNFLFFCQNTPNFVGSVLNSITNRRDVLNKNEKNFIEFYITLDSEEKIDSPEKSYQKVRKKLLTILESPKILKIEISEVIILIESISIPRLYRQPIRRVYYTLFLELINSLLLLYNIEDLNKMFGINNNLLINHRGFLHFINKIKRNSNVEHKFLNIMLEDLNNIYNRIEKFQLKTKNLKTIPNSKKFTPNESQLKIFKDFEKQHNFISRSESMLEVFDLVKRYKDEISILITGESGVGKELIVKAIHKESDRKSNPLISVDCASGDNDTLDSTLFGHVKGAFTSADKERTGIFERADKGTVFLDEFGDMPLKMQNKLLRVIQENTFTKFGGEKEITVDFRLICATNKNLNELVQQGKFKEDLLNRIDVAHIEIPSLNERPDDIPYLAEYLFNKFQKKYIPNQYNRAPNWISSNNFTPLKQHNWKKNVRGLEHYLERFVIYNKEDLAKLKPGMLRKLFKDKKIAIQDLVKNPTSSDKIFRESKYFEILMLFIENHYDRVKTTEISSYHKDTVRSRLNSCMLQLGMEFEFQQEGMIDYLIDRKILIDDDREIFTMNITVIFKSIIASTLKGTKKTFFDPPDKQLVDNLFKLRNDLVTQVKNNTL